MSVYDLIKDEFGVETYERENPLTDTVGTSVTRVLPYSPSRVSCVIVNLGGYDLYVSPRNNVSGSKGILIPANGGNLTLIWREDFTLVAHEFFGISPNGSVDVYILELLESSG